jgi:hypothetical protein
MNKLTLVAVAVLAALALVGVVVLTALGLDVPDVLGLVVTGALGILGGATLPRSSTGASSSTDDDGGTGAPASAYGTAPSALVRRDTGNLLHPRAAA